VTFGQLRTFLAVAETGAVRAAAEQLVVTPSAVSTALTALQDRLGVDLVVREGRGLVLTDAGVVYADYARRILGLVEQARLAATGEADPHAGELRLGALTSAGEHVVPRLLAGFSARHPGVGLRLEVGNRERMRALLDHHEVDLVIGGRPSGDELAVHAVREHALVVVAAAPAPPGTARRVLDWLGRQSWLLRERGSGTRGATAAYLEERQLEPHTLTLGSNVAIVEAAAAGLGVTLISRDAVARHLRDGTLHTIAAPGTPLRRDWHLIAHAGRLPGAARLLVADVLATGEFVPPGRSRHAGDDPAGRPLLPSNVTSPVHSTPQRGGRR
jgi:LysR family transcriptional regulator, low CO2-responsive transcriptional regulator